MVLVTGATGMLGAHLILELLSNGESVKAIFREDKSKADLYKIFSYYTIDPDLLAEQVIWEKADISDIGSLENAMQGVNYVYHAAAQVSFNPKERQKIININRLGTANVVNACLHLNIKKLCHVSSIAALGSEKEGIPIHENSEWKPAESRSSYALSKFQSELEVWRGITEGLNAVIVNPSVILGPGNWKKGSPAMIARSKDRINYYPNGSTGFVDVRDVVQIMINLMKSDISGERFILNSHNISYYTFISLINHASGFQTPNKALKKSTLSLLSKLDYLRNIFTGKDRQLTSELIPSLLSKQTFSDSKLQEIMQFKYRDIQQSIQFFVGLYALDKKNSPE